MHIICIFCFAGHFFFYYAAYSVHVLCRSLSLLLTYSYSVKFFYRDHSEKLDNYSIITRQLHSWRQHS